eukprot:CAMPEP_0198267312 /NCGR_PEP_ID=MMETSP1447-20131203/32477_1 /TAXON_ID=420782 /ORGANISM="Chaetoceros dichaeta, Strain CCMP1751" /LENGTH=225 /DNA_ID=CAMNT_0043957843 /DNA_START=17 /DNA_END=694 /DNA_ORIENTATION=-
MKLNALFLYVITSILTPQTKGFSITPKSIIPKQSNVHSSTDLKKEPFSNLTENIGKKVLASILGSFLLLSSHTSVPILLPGGQAVANDSRIVGEIAGSGLVFKDTLTIESFEDPKVKGVTLYVSNFQRPLTERLQKDFFSDPAFASVGCAKTGPVSVADNVNMSKKGEEVFEESKSLLFKTLRVQRIYDKEKNTAVYVSFNTRLDKGSDTNKSRFKSSICVVNLD